MRRGFSDTALSRNRAALFCAAELDAGIVICGQHFRKSLGAGVCQGSQGPRQRPQRRGLCDARQKNKEPAGTRALGKRSISSGRGTNPASVP